MLPPICGRVQKKAYSRDEGCSSSHIGLSNDIRVSRRGTEIVRGLGTIRPCLLSKVLQARHHFVHKGVLERSQRAVKSLGWLPHYLALRAWHIPERRR